MKNNFVILSNSLIAKYVLTTKSTKIQCAACVQPLNNNDSRETRLILFWGVQPTVIQHLIMMVIMMMIRYFLK